MQMILMKYHTFFFLQKLGKMSQNLSFAAVVMGTLRVKHVVGVEACISTGTCLLCVNKKD